MGVEKTSPPMIEIYTDDPKPGVMKCHLFWGIKQIHGSFEGFSLFGLVIFHEHCKLTWREWENGPFEDVFSIEDRDFPASHVSLLECTILLLMKEILHHLGWS